MYRLIFLILSSAAQSVIDSSDPSLKTPAQPDELAKSYGYHAERHEVTTDDGYILTVFRILNLTNYVRTRYAEPFILQHGMTSNSGQWVINGREDSLAFILADHGFDVWLSNTRGTAYSRRHKTLSPESPEFWNFSWHEHGTLDMPATVDFILNKTGHRQVWYSGHSMGTTLFFVMNSMRPEYNNKVRHMFALAPSAYVSHSVAARGVTPGAVRSMEVVGRTFYKNHFKADFIIMKFSKSLCTILEYQCGQSIKMMMGYNPRANVSFVKNGFLFFPDYMSVGEITHYGQSAVHPFRFRQYDYYHMNMMKYKSLEPPKYPLHRITTPITLMYSSNDNAVGTKDVVKLSQDLPNARLYLVPDPHFNHLDFAISPKAKELIYFPILRSVSEIQKNG